MQIKLVTIITFIILITCILGCKKDDAPSPTYEDGPAYLLRYCEVLMATVNGSLIDADVYNTMGCNACPQGDWDSLDYSAIATEYNVTLALENGPRWWVIDSLDGSNNPIGVPCDDTIGTLPMTLVASVTVSAGSSNASYTESTVSRNTVYHFNEGREVYQLQSDSGECYIMQSFTNMIDSTLTQNSLSELGDVLDLPDGWSFSVHSLESHFELSTVNGEATVVTDDLQNTYQWLNNGCLN